MEKRKRLLGLAGLLALMVLFACLYFATRPAQVEGQKQITLTITHGDGQSRALLLTTQENTLGDLLCSQSGLIEYEESPYGRYIRAVEGEAEEKSQQLWWCITQNGQQHDAGMDSTVLADGQRYELTFKKGYSVE